MGPIWNFMPKFRKVQCPDFLIKLEKPHFGSISEPLWLKNFKKTFFPTDYLLEFDLCCCNFRKFPWTDFLTKLEKPHFGLILALLAQRLQNEKFPKNAIRETLRLCFAVILCKKSVKCHMSIFHKTWRNTFWTILSHFSTKISEQDFFKKIELNHCLR